MLISDPRNRHEMRNPLSAIVQCADVRNANVTEIYPNTNPTEHYICTQGIRKLNGLPKDV
jgi:hypothetical protein